MKYFSIFPFLAWKKTKRGKNKRFYSRGKNESCAVYTVIHPWVKPKKRRIKSEVILKTLIFIILLDATISSKHRYQGGHTPTLLCAPTNKGQRGEQRKRTPTGMVNIVKDRAAKFWNDLSVHVKKAFIYIQEKTWYSYSDSGLVIQTSYYSLWPYLGS